MKNFATVPVIGLVAGDPAGVGPELLAEALKNAPDGVRLEVIGDPSLRNPGQPDREGSLRAIASLEEAASRAFAGELAAVVTGPVNKRNLHQVGFEFPGQTEFFAARAGVENFAMLLIRVFRLIGLLICSSKPFDKQCCRSSFRAWAVKANMGVL